MSNHTPGPWFFNDDNDHITSELREGKAEIAICETGWSEPFESEQQANARLIAAAPELLEALQAMFAATADTEIHGVAGSPLELARYAIAKATQP